MKFFILFYSLVLCFEFSETLFLFPDITKSTSQCNTGNPTALTSDPNEKHAIFLCLKVCPLYCSKRQRRDARSYWDDSEVVFDWPPSSVEVEDEHPYYSYHPYHVGRWVYCVPCKSSSTTKKPTTTTKKPTTTTTTEEPTWICEVCQKKCGVPKS